MGTTARRLFLLCGWVPCFSLATFYSLCGEAAAVFIARFQVCDRSWDCPADPDHCGHDSPVRVVCSTSIPRMLHYALPRLRWYDPTQPPRVGVLVPCAGGPTRSIRCNGDLAEFRRKPIFKSRTI